MKWFLLLFLGTTGVVIVGLCVLALFVRGRLTRHHRVDPKVATPAPLTWLADPRAPARAHRRLARVGRVTHRVAIDHGAVKRRLRRAPEPTPIAAIALDLRREAVRLDAHLRQASLLAPAPRRRRVAELTIAVGDVERTAERLVILSDEARTPPVLVTEAPDLTDLAGQVERMVAAHRELTSIDAGNGLVPLPQPQLQR